jgi:hypothetical protein
MYRNSVIANIYRSPDAVEGGGSTPEAPASSETPASSPASTPEYVSRSDFESFRNELSGYFRESARNRQDNRSESPKDSKPSEAREPNENDYDFRKVEDVRRYNKDVYSWHRHQERQEEAKTNAEKEVTERLRKTESGHRQRIAEYRKENPSFDDDLRKAGNISVHDMVKQAIYRSKSSAPLVHYLALNKGLADELNELADIGEHEDLMERVGEIVAQMKAEKSALEANSQAAKDRPPRQNFRGNSPSKDREPTLEERFNRFRK